MSHITSIRNFYFKNNQLPNMSEAMELLGASSKTTIFRLYNKMVELGYLSKSDRKYYPTDLLGALPLYGSVQAGEPTQEPSEVQDHINISSFLIEHPESTFLVSVRGDSMIGAGLVEGDIVVVDKNYSIPKVNDIVIATVDDDSDFTIKYYGMIRNNPVLLPDNSKYSVIVPKNTLTVHGKVVGSLRKY